MSGTAVAATQINGNNIKPQTIGGGKLKPQTIHGSKLKQFTGGLIKKETIPAGKIQPNSLGGNQIDESRLGPVPTASRLAGSYQGKVAFGQSVELAKVGPFTLTGQCLQNGTTDDGTEGRDIARIVIATTEVGAVFTSDLDSKTGSAADQFLGPDTAEADRVVSEVSTETGSANYKAGGQFSAIAASGAGMVSPAGASTAAINLFDTGCVFQGATQVTG
ncbi:MAG TPA: hypothetical protein VMF31_00855 [Solirubrobacterales bacterium]|nr:hypothetical protein [Solirubrobacterales bacterium]